jgi:hypothetical protein
MTACIVDFTGWIVAALLCGLVIGFMGGSFVWKGAEERAVEKGYLDIGGIPYKLSKVDASK